MKKILIIQMHRLGDIILSAPTLKYLRDTYPEAEIHLLFNSQFRNVKPLLPSVDKFIGFDRNKLQRRLKHRNVPYYSAFETIKKLVSYLKSQNYDQVVNLTHTKLSGYIAETINCPNTSGLKYGRETQFGAESFRFLNNHGLSSGRGLIHFADLFLQGVGGGLAPRRISLQETERGFSEIKNTIGQMEFQLAVQPLTSDSKKNWGLGNFEKFILSYHKLNPEHNIALIGAPNEKNELKNLYFNLREMNVPIHLVICSLEGAFSLLRKSKVIVTGDTSIKHIAAATHARVVELSLGSSHLNFTGIYKKNAYILQAQDECVPCDHSSTCKFGDHRCRSKLDPLFVARFVSGVYARDTQFLEYLARRHGSSVGIYKTFIDYKLGWFAAPIAVTTEAAFDLLHQFLRSTQVQGFSLHECLQGFWRNVSLTVNDWQEWLTRIAEIKRELESLDVPTHSLQAFNSTTRWPSSAFTLLSFHLREHSYADLKEIKDARILTQILTAVKSDIQALRDTISDGLEMERTEQWTQTASNNFERQ